MPPPGKSIPAGRSRPVGGGCVAGAMSIILMRICSAEAEFGWVRPGTLAGAAATQMPRATNATAKTRDTRVSREQCPPRATTAPIAGAPHTSPEAPPSYRHAVPTAISPQELRVLRLQAQFLAENRVSDVATAVRRIVAVQAQSTPAARLAVRSRTTGLTRDDVDGACRDGTLVRTWAMRGTLHMLAAEDVRWIIALLGPHFTRTGKRRRDQLGLDPDTCRRGLAAIERVLEGSRPLTRAELMAGVSAEGVVIDRTDQAPAHLVRYAATQGLICRGPEVGADEPTYVLLDEWVAPAPPVERDEALARLARRYLAGHGPAAAADLATWSGLPMSDARAALELIDGELVDVDVAGIPMVALPSAGVRPCHDAPPRLLGRFDGYLLGYRTRELILDPAYATRILDGGMIQAAVVVAGRVVGTWRQERRELAVRPFTTLPRGSRRAIRGEASDIARFLGVPTTFAVHPA